MSTLDPTVDPALDTARATRPDQTGPVRVTAHAIDPARLDRMRSTGRDDLGQAPTPWRGGHDVPLRCCLRLSRPDDRVLLLSYSPFTTPSPWREVGPVFVHAERCTGHDPASGLPPELRSGPRVLRGYDDDHALRYDAVRAVARGDDVEETLADLLSDPTVAEVHVRALREQCFTYVATRV